MIAVDTNILVYAHRGVAPEHERAVFAVDALIAEPGGWALPWPVAHEFVKVVTSIPNGVPLDTALGMLERLLDAPGCTPIAETPGHGARVAGLARAARASGTLFYDARIAAICMAHGVREIWSADRDYGRFPTLRVRNPLIG